MEDSDIEKNLRVVVRTYAENIVAAFLNGTAEDMPREEWLNYEHPDRERMEGEMVVMLEGCMAECMGVVAASARRSVSEALSNLQKGSGR